MRNLAVIVLLVALAGCVRFPAIEDATTEVARQADFPELIPLDPIADVLAGPEPETLETDDKLEARVSNLQSRADSLRTPVLDADDRARLSQTPQ
ncbi:MAG: hypothetical protein R8G34_22240 [Paracoccaceae bacterium]|nr:hypothetical protein [Paracoccaceae bacterium]